MDPILTACAQHNICAIVGAATRLDGDLRISSLIIDAEGKIRGHYHKQFLFSNEQGLYTAGNSDIILELCGWLFGLAICYDTGFAEHARAAAQNGCHVYLASALFSQGNGAHERAIWFPARALDNTMFTALSNHVGITGGWKTCGESAVWSPYGDIVSKGSADTQEIVLATLEPDLLRNVRQQETMLTDISARPMAPAHPFNVIKLDPSHA